MDEFIVKYLRKELILFYEFLITYEGNLAGKWITDISVKISNDNEECKNLSNSDIIRLIDRFIEHEKRTIHSDK